MAITTKTIETKIPARMDRLPWARWHWLVVWALGAVWILDGLEVTMKGAVGSRLTNSHALGLTAAEVGLAASIYIAGAISGSLFWGYLTDRLGRRKLFMVTLALYMVGVLLTGLAWGFIPFVVFRFITGFAIGGEYSAINSAIDELIPARARGWVDLAVNGSYWLGTIFAASLSLLYLDTNIFPVDLGWRVAFFTGLILAFGLMLLRRHVPESPRWLMTHGRPEEAERIVAEIEHDVMAQTGQRELPDPPDDDAIEIRERESVGFVEIARTAFKVYPKRTLLGFSLMGTQAFLYNAIFFTYGLVLTTFYGVSDSRVGLYLIPFAVGNFLGPLILGRYFDTVGRKPMISSSYILAGVFLIVTGWFFAEGDLTALTLTAGWVVVFFFASAGASAGYLTVSETFPLEIRAMAIAFFYSVSTGIGGIIGPWLFGHLIGDGTSRFAVYDGYLVGAGLMIIGGIVELTVGVKAEGKSLESVAKPLSADDAESEAGGKAEIPGPLGLDLADGEAVRHFQEDHGLAATGDIDAATRGALSAILTGSADQDGEDGERVGDHGVVLEVDVTNGGSVRAFQRAHGLQPDGVIGERTRGAMLVEQSRLGLDATDTESVKRFQRGYHLCEDGVIGPVTQAAMRAVASERRAPTCSDDGEDEAEVDETNGSLAALTADMDITDQGSVERFQQQLGLEATGTVDAETQGALAYAQSTLEHRSGVDVSDPGSVQMFQRRAGLEPDGIVGPATRQRLRELDPTTSASSPRRAGVDPTDPDSVKRFQRQHDIDASGEVDDATGAAIRHEERITLGVDPTDVESVRRFQQENGLNVDGIIGEETRGAMRAVRAELDEGGDSTDDECDDDVSPGRLLDPADGEAVREFQHRHGLHVDGIIGDGDPGCAPSGAGRARPAVRERGAARRVECAAASATGPANDLLEPADVCSTRRAGSGHRPGDAVARRGARRTRSTLAS